MKKHLAGKKNSIFLIVVQIITTPLIITVSQHNSLTEERDELKRTNTGKSDDDLNNQALIWRALKLDKWIYRLIRIMHKWFALMQLGFHFLLNLFYCKIRQSFTPSVLQMCLCQMYLIMISTVTNCFSFKVDLQQYPTVWQW